MWWNNLALVEQIFFIVACAGSGIFLLRMILLIIGISDFTDFDINFGDGQGIGLFALQGVNAFMVIGGWAIYGFSRSGLSLGLALSVGGICGITGIFMMFFLIKALSKFETEGTVEMKRGIGKTAEVYLFIPANMKGHGKINLDIQGRLIEADAVTAENNEIKTGEFVNVTGYENNKYIVEKKEQ